MKKITFSTVIFSTSILLFSCAQADRLPPAVTTVEQAATLLKGKTWQVVDVATISGSQISFFDGDPSKKVAMSAPSAESLNWLSDKKGAAGSNEFIQEFYNKKLEISIALNKDSVAMVKGMDDETQTFVIENSKDDDETKEVKLLLTGESEAFEGMDINKFTATYYILGASEKKLFLLTPNELNRLKVAFLLEAK